MTPYIVKITSYSGENVHYINLNRVNRISLTSIPNSAFVRFYAHYTDGDFDIAISVDEAKKVQEYLSAFI